MKKILPVTIVLIIASFLIFFKYDQIPKGLAHDENELARTAFSLEKKPYTPYTTVADGHGTPYFYALLLSFKLFGVNQFALRLPSRIFGILNILLFYLILRLVFNKEKLLTTNHWLLATLLFLTSHWYLHFTRIALETPFLLFLELASLYFILHTVKKPVAPCVLLSAIFSGLAFNSYQPGRIFFIVPLLVLLVKKVNWRSIVYFLVIFAIMIFPMSFYLITHPGNDIRIDQQFFLKNTELSIDKKIKFLSSNIQTTSLMFFTNGDINGQHNYSGKPALNPVLAMFFTIGLFLALFNLKEFSNKLFLFYFFIAIIPTILTYPWENPNMLRTYTALPSIVYFIGLTFLEIYRLIKKKYKKYLFIFIYLSSALYLLSSIYELRTYFKYQRLVFKQAFDKPDNLNIIRQDILKQEVIK